MAGLAGARHRYDMMWLSRHGVVGTALCMLVGPCPAVPTWPEKYSHISAKLCINCLKLSGHTGRHDRSRQGVVYLYKMCAQNAWICPAIPAVAAGQNNCRDRPCHRLTKVSCRAIIMSCRVAACRHTYVTNELYCIG